MTDFFVGNYFPNRRAVIHVSRVLLEQLLYMPDGVHIVGVAHDMGRDTLRLVIEGEQIDESDPLFDAPVISPVVKTETTGKLVPEIKYQMILYPGRK